MNKDRLRKKFDDLMDSIDEYIAQKIDEGPNDPPAELPKEHHYIWNQYDNIVLVYSEYADVVYTVVDPVASKDGIRGIYYSKDVVIGAMGLFDLDARMKVLKGKIKTSEKTQKADLEETINLWLVKDSHNDYLLCSTEPTIAEFSGEEYWRCTSQMHPIADDIVGGMENVPWKESKRKITLKNESRE